MPFIQRRSAYIASPSPSRHEGRGNTFDEIASPHCLPRRRRTTPNRTQLQQGFVTDGMGFRVKLHGSNFEPLMSALPPKADIGSCFVVSCYSGFTPARCASSAHFGISVAT